MCVCERERERRVGERRGEKMTGEVDAWYLSTTMVDRGDVAL